MKNYLYCIMLFCLAGCQMQYKPLFNENVALDYCYSQVNRALKDIVDSNGTYNYSMMPRNIHWCGRLIDSKPVLKNGALASGPAYFG